MTPQAKETRVFVRAHVLLLCVVFVGFARTFYLRDALGTKPLNVPLQLHGAALTFWFGLTVVQGLLIQAGNRVWHARLAWWAVAGVVGVVVSGAWVNTALALQLLSARDPENMFIWANYMSLLSFLTLVVAAVALRHRPAFHRRLMLLASIAIIGPAFARLSFWPWVGMGLEAAPAFAGAGMLMLLLAAIGYDLGTLRRPHRATLWGVAGIVLPLIAGIAVAVSGVGFALIHPGA